MARYSVRTPAFDPTSGGIRVMWGLYGWLLAKGQIAYPNAQYDTKFVGIYPEIYSGNDLGATKVIRYVLQTPGLMAHHGVAGPSTEEIKNTSDDIYVFSRIYDTIGVDEDHILFLPILNVQLFKDQGLKRSKSCYLVGKGVNQHKHPQDSIELTREFAKDQAALAKLLNQCSVLYCYDRLSAMMEIARLCGCRVQYYGDFSPKEIGLYEPGMNGLGYGDEKAKLVPEAFRKHYISLIDTFSQRLDKFIAATQVL
jgi:hypothetical protein